MSKDAGVQFLRVYSGGAQMGEWIMPPAAGLIEPAVAPEFYSDAIGAIELVGSCIRIYFCSEQMPLEVVGEPQLIVMAKVVRPLKAVPLAIGNMAKCLYTGERSPGIQTGGPWPRLVR